MSAKCDCWKEGSPPLTRGQPAVSYRLEKPSGSPPLTRGQPLSHFKKASFGRITPAHAGTTASPASDIDDNKDHPRSRGDNYCANHFLLSILGSPPLTRGQRRRLCDGLSQLGITPAHAGTTILRLAAIQLPEDHPRSRGDNCLWCRRRRARPWITPAHAGTTLPNMCKKMTCRDHPPLTRGQRRPGVPLFVDVRITPAHAGTTGSYGRRPHRAQDHPRSRGDNEEQTDSVQLTVGSPPLTRGQPVSKNALVLLSGITPAHAGTTQSR